MHYKLGSFYANERLQKMAYDPEADAFNTKNINLRNNPYENTVRSDMGKPTWGSYMRSGFNTAWYYSPWERMRYMWNAGINPAARQQMENQYAADSADLLARTAGPMGFTSTYAARENVLKDLRKKNLKWLRDNSAKGSAAQLMAQRELGPENGRNSAYEPSEAYKTYAAAGARRINMHANAMGAQTVNAQAPAPKPAAPLQTGTAVAPGQVPPRPAPVPRQPPVQPQAPAPKPALPLQTGTTLHRKLDDR